MLRIYADLNLSAKTRLIRVICGLFFTMPLLPNAELAVIDLAKLTDYCLNPFHRYGKHKARVFWAALGLTVDEAEWLQGEILQAICTTDMVVSSASVFGTKFTVDFVVRRANRSAMIRTGWIIEHGTDFPRLTTCYVKE